jgi:hypothetical protein
VDPVEIYGGVDDALHAYPRLVDDEEINAAEGLLRGLIATGVPMSRIRHALLSAITDHFLGYGHPMIYAQKAFELLDGIGWEHADVVLGPLVPNMTLSTRYDRLPYMRKFLEAWDRAEVDLERQARLQKGAPSSTGQFMTSILDGDPEDALASLSRALDAGAGVESTLDATALAAAERFRRFDIDLDVDDTNEWGWLDVTHNLTYVNALRWAWSVDQSPEVLRGLYHAVWFVNFTKRFDRRDHSGKPVAFSTADASEVLSAVRKRDPDGAVAAVEGYVGVDEDLHAALAQAGSEDNAVAPIMVAHSVKTTRAAIVESSHLRDRAPLAAAARFLASPKRERFVYNATLEAIDFTQGRARGEGT